MSDPRLSALMITSLGTLNKPQWRLLWGTLKGYFLIAPRPRCAYPTQSKPLKIILDIRYQDAIMSPTGRCDSTRPCSPCPPATRSFQLPQNHQVPPRYSLADPPSLVSPLFPACSTLFQRARILMIPQPLAFLCFHILTRSFARSKNSTLLFSSASALFAQNTRGGGEPYPTEVKPKPATGRTAAGPFQFEKTLRNKRTTSANAWSVASGSKRGPSSRVKACSAGYSNVL
jgi:hypothetical protein